MNDSNFCWFVFFFSKTGQARLSKRERETLASILRPLMGLGHVLVHEPVEGTVAHPFPDDGVPPILAVQIYARTIAELEAMVAPDGSLAVLLDTACFPSLADCTAVQQAMVVRRFDAPCRANGVDQSQACSYLVHYPGQAEDCPLWLEYYVKHHPAIMTRFPGIEEIEIYSRLDWCGGLPLPRGDCMQRNKLVFRDPESLSHALLSDVIRDMRADYHQFPPFTGGNIHYVVATHAPR